MREPPTTTSRRAAGLRALTLAAIVGYAALASGLRTLTWTATAAVLLPATIAMAVVVHRPQPAMVPMSEPRVDRAVWVWSSLVLAGLLWEAWAFVHQPGVTVASYQHPSLSSLVGPWLHDRTVRLGAWMLWLYTGWRLVRR